MLCVGDLVQRSTGGFAPPPDWAWLGRDSVIGRVLEVGAGGAGVEPAFKHHDPLARRES
jgi:hypothetical protein